MHINSYSKKSSIIKLGLFFVSINNLPIYSPITPNEINWIAQRKYIGKTVDAQPGTIFLGYKIDWET